MADSPGGRRRNMKQERPLYKPGKGLGGSQRNHTLNDTKRSSTEKPPLKRLEHSENANERNDPMVAVERKLEEMCLRGPPTYIMRRYERNYDRKGSPNDCDQLGGAATMNNNNGKMNNNSIRYNNQGFRFENRSVSRPNSRNRRFPLPSGRHLADSRESLHSVTSIQSNCSRGQRVTTFLSSGPPSGTSHRQFPETVPVQRGSDRSDRMSHQQQSQKNSTNDQFPSWREAPLKHGPPPYQEVSLRYGLSAAGFSQNRNSFRRDRPQNGQHGKRDLPQEVNIAASRNNLGEDVAPPQDELKENKSELGSSEESQALVDMSLRRPVRDWAEEMCAAEQENTPAFENDHQVLLINSYVENGTPNGQTNKPADEHQISDAVECREQPKGTRTGNLEAPRIDWAECPTPPPLQQSDAEDEHSSGQMPSESHSPEAHLIRNNGLQNDRTSFRKRPQEKPTRSMYRERHNSEDRNGWSHKGGHCRDRTYEIPHENGHVGGVRGWRCIPRQSHRSPPRDRRPIKTDSLPPRLQRQRELQQQQMRLRQQEEERGPRRNYSDRGR